jgi:penicillin amidase
MQQGGLHPIRRNPATGNYIKDGTTSDHDWVGVVSAENRMHLADPPKGYIIHANNRVAGEGYYGGYLNYTIFTARADRIDELIRA